MSQFFDTIQQRNLSYLGLMALGIGLFTYISYYAVMFESSAYYEGGILLAAAAIQIAIGLLCQKQERSYTAAILLPFGFFWLAIIGYEIFPKMGIGRHPDTMGMFAFLTLWALFVSLLFLSSFRQRLSMQFLTGSMMVTLLSLSLDKLREDTVFLAAGCVFGVLAAFVAVYMALVQFDERKSGTNS